MVLNKFPIFMTTTKFNFQDRSRNFVYMGRSCLILVMFDAKEYIFQHIFLHMKIHLNSKRPKFNSIWFFKFFSMEHIYMRMRDVEIFFD